jgi:hypothetical protein
MPVRLRHGRGSDSSSRVIVFWVFLFGLQYIIGHLHWYILSPSLLFTTLTKFYDTIPTYFLIASFCKVLYGVSMHGFQFQEVYMHGTRLPLRNVEWW